MNQGRTVFAQVIGHAPHKAFQRCVNRYPGTRRLRSFTCWDQFLCMVVAILKKRLHSELSLYTILQILSVSLFGKIELSQAFSRAKLAMPEESTCNQLRLFDL